MTRTFPSKLHAHKLQGAGNDFVVLDLLSNPLPADFPFPRAARALCERHRGIGADGLLTLESVSDGDSESAKGSSQVRMRMWNPDGSEDMCGNGLRCVAHLAWAQRLVSSPKFRVQTLVGSRGIEVLNSGLIRAEMGEPIFAPPQVPVAWEGENALDIQIPLADGRFAGRALRASALSTGSTHTVIFLDAPLAEAEFLEIGPLLENHALFPARTSIMFALASGPNRFQIRIWERGAGETWACGTGACAVAVAAQMTGRARGPVEVQSKGGTLSIEWQPSEPIFLTGPARRVFEASIELEI